MNVHDPEKLKSAISAMSAEVEPFPELVEKKAARRTFSGLVLGAVLYVVAIVAMVVLLGPSPAVGGDENIRSTLDTLLIPGFIVAAWTAGVHSKSFDGVAVFANVMVYLLIPALWFGLGRKKVSRTDRAG